jgi:hypothetical protein
MVFVRSLPVAALAFLLAFGPAAARPLTTSEYQALAKVVEAFDAAMRDGDGAAIMGVVPPRVLAHIASSGGTDLAALKKSTAQQMTALIKEFELESLSFDLDQAQQKELPSGDPYLLVPLVMVVKAKSSRRYRTTSQTLALLDAGKWYLVRVDQVKQVDIVRKVYPEFADVEFPSGSTEVLKD